ncbi:acetylglutamate semialdehyde dehydrogenase [Peribacillus sp. NPDC096540]|uniref:acetylglutamate semialdehyde dehydrogenase n=1 Tax=Peribacillus sp. NPDC096540 TaxID=3390612 RepID=UPI003D08997B
MVNSGELTAKDYYLQFINEKDKVFKEITRFKQSEKEYYSDLLEHLKDVNKKRTKFSNAEKGKALEDLVSFILEKSSVFEIKENIHTSSNEVDQLVMLNSTGREFQNAGYLDIRGEHLLSECKNYGGKVGVTWVGKFYSLVSVLSCRLGILFSYKGLSGSGWNNAVGLTKKLFFTREKIEDRIFIIEFNIDDYEAIANGESFLGILEAKINALKTDTKFSHYLTEHPATKKAKAKGLSSSI